MKLIEIEGEAEQEDEIPRPIPAGNKVRRDVKEKQIHPCLVRQQLKAPKDIREHSDDVSRHKPQHGKVNWPSSPIHGQRHPDERNGGTNEEVKKPMKPCVIMLI